MKRPPAPTEELTDAQKARRISNMLVCMEKYYSDKNAKAESVARDLREMPDDFLAALYNVSRQAAP